MLALALLLATQTPPSPIGIWKGTSICLMGKPTCHDEQVVYHITAGPGDSVTLAANKIVNGKEEEMGAFTCGVGAREVVCPMPKQFRPGTWRFVRGATSLDGGLWIPDGQQFREVHVSRAR